MAQEILANTNMPTLKQEVVKIPEFFSEKGKDVSPSPNLVHSHVILLIC